MNSSESSQLLKDRRQISLVALDGSMPTKIKKWKLQACFILHFNFEKGLLWKIITYSYQFIYFLSYINFNISRYQFSRLFRLYSTLSEKYFRRKFSFLNRFTQLHTFATLNGQNLLRKTKNVCQFSLRCPLKHFFFSKICWKNSVKASFMYQQRTATATVFLNKVLTTDYLILFSEHISRQLFWRKHHTYYNL